MLIAQQAHYVATLEPTRRIDVAHVGAGAERALITDRLKHEQTLAHVRTLGRHAQRIVERVALGTKLYQGLAPDVANQTLRALRDTGIVEHHGPRRMANLRPAAAPLPAAAPRRSPPRVKDRGRGISAESRGRSRAGLSERELAHEADHFSGAGAEASR
jgi:hypothetical protein